MDKIFLLADDDSDDADMFREVLLEIDPSIIFHRTWDGQEVLDTLKNLKVPDIIFLDINMPGMNGWKCLEKLKSTKSYRDIPVIIYTTSSLKRDVAIALDSGAHCFITKPNKVSELKKILELITANLNSNLMNALIESADIKGVTCSPSYKT